MTKAVIQMNAPTPLRIANFLICCKFFNVSEKYETCHEFYVALLVIHEFYGYKIDMYQKFKTSIWLQFCSVLNVVVSSEKVKNVSKISNHFTISF